MKAEVLVYDGFDELDAIAPFEVLENAARLDSVELEVRLVAEGGPREVVAAHGLRIAVDRDIGGEPDLILVPGGGWNNKTSSGARAEFERGILPDIIAGLHTAGTTVAAVCTGTMLLAAAGITKDRPAVTHHGAVEDLRDSGAEVVDARVVDDGDVLTAGGVTSGLDLALWILERYFGSAVAALAERRMEYERRGTVWRRDGRSIG